MSLKKYILNTFPTVKPFEGINSIEKRLLKLQYLVVLDDDKKFYGILTIPDIIEHPHKIVIDSITPKQCLTVNDTIVTALDSFYSTMSFALPVIDGGCFVGVIEKNQIIKELETNVNDLYNKSLISQNAKKHFLNNLSHEIRTPLNGVLGFIDIIAHLDTDDLTNQGENISAIIRRSADHFLIIMDDLVELSLINAGDKVIIEKAEVDIVKMLVELKEYFNELSFLQNKKNTVIYFNQESYLSIYTDGKKLKQILYHLIDNALKFSDDNTVFYGFEFKPNDKDIKFFVNNKSSKIPQKDIRKMFNIFEKQENIGSELNFGLGIGLPLVKNLTELLGGQITIESKTNEITFFIKLPIK